MTTSLASHDPDDIREAQQIIKRLQEEIISYQEIITIKDNVVMGISNQLTDLTEQQQQQQQQQQQTATDSTSPTGYAVIIADVVAMMSYDVIP